jgi:hypothetical protein
VRTGYGLASAPVGTLIRKTSLLQDRSDGLCGQATADMSDARGFSAAFGALGVRIVGDLIGHLGCSERSPLHDVRQHASAERLGRDVTGMRNFIRGRVSRIPAGGARRDRTDDLLLAKQALSQLSYGPGRPAARLRQGSGGQPSGFEGWWAWEDLNFRPHAYQARALTN